MLDVVIGLALVFALFAGLVSGINEILAQVLGWRGKVLREGIENLLEKPLERRASTWMKEFATPESRASEPTAGDGSSVVARLYAHPLVSTLSQPASKPSYVPPATFSAALVQTLSQGGSLSALRAALDDRTSQLGRLFGPMLDDANGDLQRFEIRVEAQFTAVMDRVEGWYKRRTQLVMAMLALLLAIALNVDAVHVMRSLQDDASLRDHVVQAASKASAAARIVGTPAAPADPTAAGSLGQKTRDLDEQVSKLLALEVPVGWTISKSGFPLQLLSNQGLPLLGWLFTAIAGMLGAPFWFDAISTLIDIRGAGRKPEAGVSAGGLREPLPSSGGSSGATAPAVVAGATPPPAGPPLNDFEATRLMPDDVEALQRALGVPEARIDGVLGEELRSLLREWQRIRRRTVSGRFDEPTVLEILYDDRAHGA